MKLTRAVHQCNSLCLSLSATPRNNDIDFDPSLESYLITSEFFSEAFGSSPCTELVSGAGGLAEDVFF